MWWHHMIRELALILLYVSQLNLTSGKKEKKKKHPQDFLIKFIYLKEYVTIYL